MGGGGAGKHQRGVSWEERGLFPCILATLLAPDQRAREGMGDVAPAGWRGETRKDAFRPLVLPLRTPDHSRWAPNEAKRKQEIPGSAFCMCAQMSLTLCDTMD